MDKHAFVHGGHAIIHGNCSGLGTYVVYSHIFASSTKQQHKGARTCQSLDSV
jgi:hypothetical protein